MNRTLGSFLLPTLLAALPASASPQLNEDLKLLAGDGTASDVFGYTVSVDSGRAVIGAIGVQDVGSEAGSAYVFDVNSGLQLLELSSLDRAVGDRFGIGVAIEGNLALVGARGEDGDNFITNSGSGYVFDASTGQQLFKLRALDPQFGALLGSAAAIDGGLGVLGAPGSYTDAGAAKAGAAHVFDLTTGQEVSKLVALDAEAEDQLGRDVAISGNRVLVGAGGEDDNGDRAGAAYVFDATTGQQLLKLTPDDAEALDQFGYSVALQGDRAVVGATGDDDMGSNAGAAYVFDVTTGQQLFKLLPAALEANDVFGSTAAIDGGRILVASQGDDDGGSAAGAVYVFDLQTGQELAKLLASDGAADDYFGISLAAEAGQVVVGAPFQDDLGSQSGSAYVFDLGGDCGTRYCGADQNPENVATISISTCDSASSSILLTLEQGPTNQFAYLVVGDGTATVSQPPGASGDLCVAGGGCLGRYIQDIGKIDAAGTFSTDIVNALSSPCGGAVILAPGATWNFQFWHRQASAPSTFSQAISVTFE